MSTETPRLASLRKKLKACDGKYGYGKRCEALRKEIERLEGKRDLDL